MLTGFTTTIVGGRTQISQGNPDLKPERSTSFDVGAEWTARDDAVRRHGVPDRREGPLHLQRRRQQSAAAGSDRPVGRERPRRAHQRPRAGGGAAARRAASASSRTPRTTSTARSGSRAARSRTSSTSPMNTVRAGVDVDFGRLSARVSGRYVQGRKDNDFNAPGFPIVDYDNFTVVDASATYRLVRQHAIVARDQQRVRRVLLREDRLSAAGRVVQAVVPASGSSDDRASLSRLASALSCCDSSGDRPAAPRRSLAPAAANLTQRLRRDVRRGGGLLSGQGRDRRRRQLPRRVPPVLQGRHRARRRTPEVRRSATCSCSAARRRRRSPAIWPARRS